MGAEVVEVEEVLLQRVSAGSSLHTHPQMQGVDGVTQTHLSSSRSSCLLFLLLLLLL